MEHTGERLATMEEQIRCLRRDCDAGSKLDNEVRENQATFRQQIGELNGFRREAEAVSDAQGKRLNEVENENKALRDQIKALLSAIKVIATLVAVVTGIIELVKHG